MRSLQKGFGPLLLTGCMAFALMPVAAVAVSTGDSNAVPVVVNDEAVEPAPQQLYALGMIETGNNDRDVGGLGEISRYQIRPTVWKCYSKSSQYANPDVSLQVARRHWMVLARNFKTKAGREPDSFDMYVLWNTGLAYYESKGFAPHQVARVVRDRAQRYVNLVNRKA
jgi:hypothetical protein